MMQRFLAGLVILFTFVMVGCATKIEKVYVEKPVYRPIPSAMLDNVQSAVPPSVAELSALRTADERLTRVLNFGALQTFFLGVANMRIDKIRDWDKEQAAMENSQ